MSRRFTGRLPWSRPVAVWAVGLLLFVAALDARGLSAGEGPSPSLATVRQRYADLVRYHDVNWDDPTVKDTAQQIEFDAGNLLQGQITDAGSPWLGCFQKAEQKVPGGEALLTARRKTEKAIELLCSAYWCEPNRFYQSQRVLRAIELGYAFLNRSQDLKNVAAVADMVAPHRYAPEDLSRWLAQAGDSLPKPVRADMKDRLRKSLGRIRTQGSDFLLDTLIGAACLEDDRLAQSVRDEMGGTFRAKIAKDGSVLGPQGEICVEDAAREFYNVARYQYLTKGTEYALPESVTLQAKSLLTEFLAWTLGSGRADLLTFSAPYNWTGEVEERIAMGAAYLAPILPPDSEPLPAACGEALRRASSRRFQVRNLLDLHPLIGHMQIDSSADLSPRAKYFEDGGYLVARRPSFFASLRLPMAKGATPQFARLVGATNLRTEANDPNMLFTMPEFEPVLPGCTFSHYVARKKDTYIVRDVSGTICADAAVLDGAYAMSGAQITLRRKENSLCVNKSWTFLEDKIIVAASGLAAKSVDAENKAWSASPTDHRAWITLSFPKAIEFDFVRVYFRVYAGKLFCVPRVIYFMVSQDGMQWTRVREAKETDLPRSGDMPLGGMTFRLRRSAARYFRLFFPEDADGFTTQIAEVELYNIGAMRDSDPIPPGAENLARLGRAIPSSTFDDRLGPERVNDGDWVVTVEPASVTTCIAFFRTGKSPFVYLGRKGTYKMTFPDVGGEERIKGVRWCHIKQTAYLFLKPEDLILKGVGTGYGTISIDHSDKDSFAYVCFPDLDVDLAPSVAEAGVVKQIRLDPLAHVFKDETTGITAAAFFGPVKGDELSSDGPAYLLYRRDPALLAASKSRRSAASDVWVRAPDVNMLVVNGALQTIYKNGPMVRITAHR